MKKKTKIALMAFMALLPALGIGAQNTADRLDEASDSTAIVVPGLEEANTSENYQSLVRSKMNLMARAYGDSIVLRWAPEDYVSWKYLNLNGYTLLRMGDGGLDTLAHGLKPLSKEQMLAKYTNPADSLAGMVAELTWGNGRMKYNQTRNKPGTMGAMVELSEEQNMMFGFAVLISEWRRDLAGDLALRFVDRTAKRGQHYQYVLQPTVWDEDSMLIFQPGFIPDIENTRYTPERFDVQISDSIVSAFQVDLEWPLSGYSSFEIERRPASGASGWQRVNDLPFVPFLKEDVAQETALFADFVHEPGTYEYRVRAHDAFGDLTEPSPSITVELGDLTPPSMPTVTHIDIERPGDRVLAHIYWEKETREDDLAGFLPLYFNRRVSDQWRPLPVQTATGQQDMAAPQDSVCTVDVTGLMTGMLVVAAVDQAGNAGYSMPVQIRIEDMLPPPAPQNLKANVEPNGRVTLTWDPAADDVDYYQIAFANDTTHAWQIRNEAELRDTFYVDSLALDVNQKYIYYKVRAVDFSTNEGPYSDYIQVKRPTLTRPTVAHLDSAWVDTEGVHMAWVTGRDELMDYHLLYRRLDSAKEWTLLGRFDADSLQAGDCILRFTDNPPYNKTQRYRYAVESFNTSQLSSGLSLSYIVRRRPPVVIDCTIKLEGVYIADKKETRLAWDLNGLKDVDDYYFSIYRLDPGEELYHFVTTTKKDEQQYEDVILKPGQTAEYYVKLMTRDGRTSKASNVVSITATGRPTER